jgi:hypothetical protein
VAKVAASAATFLRRAAAFELVRCFRVTSGKIHIAMTMNGARSGLGSDGARSGLVARSRSASKGVNISPDENEIYNVKNLVALKAGIGP